jgi:ferredoxin-type protein NapH
LAVKERLLKWNTPRRIVQLLSFIFFSAVVFSLGSLPILVPVLWTWGLQQNTVADAYTAIQLMLYNVVFPWLAVASFLVVGILIGKSMCGWVCPFGFVQDLTGYIRRKKRDFSPRTHETIIYVKYFILAVTLFISMTFAAAKLAGTQKAYESAIGIFARAPFTTLSPAETLFGLIPRSIQSFSNTLAQGVNVDFWSVIAGLPVLVWAQIVIMVGVVVFTVWVPRGWCRYLCPHGAIMAVLNRFSFIGLRRDLAKCTKGQCRVCVEVCPTRVRILDLPWEKFSDPECIYCMKCVDACEHGAIKLKYP